MAFPTTTDATGPGAIGTLSPAFVDLDDWHAKAKLLREQDPYHRVEIEGYAPHYLLTRHADVFQIEREHEIFYNTLRSVQFKESFYDEQQATGLIVKSLVQMDGQEHREYRKLTNDWFKPANLRRLVEARVNELAREYVDRMMERGPECDFAREIGLLFPLHVIMSILGVQESDEPLMLRLTQELFANEDPEFGEEDPLATLMAAAETFFNYFNDLTVEKRKNPADDIATVIANGTLGDKPVGDLERIGYYMIVATAGHDTTSNSINVGLETLINQPDQMQALKDDPSLIDNAVDEIIRWATPVRHFLRFAQQDYDLNGLQIKEGEAVLLSYLSANRDESVFEDPFKFDIRRENANAHLAFGTGVHFCLGAHLARMEIKAFFRELLPRLKSAEIVGSCEQAVSNFVGGTKNLPLRYEITPAA